MKNTLFLTLLATLFIMSACNDDPGASNLITQPGQSTKAVPEMYMDLSTTQAAFFVEMTYLQEDMSILLNPSQLSTFTTIVSSLVNDTRVPHRMSVDVDALLWFNLLYKANPDLDPDIFRQIRQLIAESASRRTAILTSGANRTDIASQLQAEHEALMAAINGLVGKEAVANAEKLKTAIENQRKEIIDRMVETRIATEAARMKAVLGLNDEQTTALTEILKYQHNQIQALQEQFKSNPEGLRQAIQDLLEDIEARMKNVLGEELWVQWLKFRTGKATNIEPVDPIQQQVDHLTRLLGLTPEQAAQLKNILKDQQSQIDAIRKNASLNPREQAEAIARIQKETDATIIARLGLTREQIEQYNRWRGAGNVKPTDPVDPIQQQVDILTRLLGLTPEQAAQLKNILKDQQSQIDAIMKDASLNPREQAEAIARIQKETDATIIARLGLTREQIELYNRWRGGGNVKPTDPVDPIQQQVDILTRLLGLTPEQAAQLKNILKDQQSQIDAIMKNASLNPREQAEAIARIQKETDATIIARLGLTKEQIDQYNRWRGGGNVKPTDPVDPVDPIQQQVDHLTRLLGLNPDQSAQLKSILVQQQTQIKALMSNSQNLNRRELTEKITQIQKETDEKILNTLGLTEEQKMLYMKWKSGG